MITDFSWVSHENLGWPSLIILGAVIGLAILVFFVFFFNFPTRPRKAGWMQRLKKQANHRQFARRREQWMDQVGQDIPGEGLDLRDRRKLAKHLSSVHPALRKKAAEVLREKGGAEGIREAQKQLSKRGDPSLVVDAIVRAQWNEMEPALLPLLVEGSEKVAAAAICALAEVGGVASLSMLLAQKGRPALAAARARAIVRLETRLG
jgi:hypothetical protein